MIATLLAMVAAIAAFVLAYLYLDKCAANRELQAQNETLVEQNKLLYEHLPQKMAA